MKKKSSVETVSEPRMEYNLEELLPEGVQGKYVERYRAGTNLVLLDPEIAKAFPTKDSVNHALRLVMQLAGIAQPIKQGTISLPAKKRSATIRAGK
jgi:hypothetical protein